MTRKKILEKQGSMAWLALVAAAALAVGLLGVVVFLPQQPAQAQVAGESTTLVTNLDDSGSGSLRDAIANATGGGTITFADGLSGTIVLTSRELNINKSLTIEGPGADKLAISGNNSSRVFFIAPEAEVAISGLTIKDGAGGSSGTLPKTFGGGISNSGTLTLTNSVIRDNHADLQGGGIVNDGRASLTVKDSTISGNEAGQGGAIYNSGSATGGGSMMLINSTISGNEASDVGGGITTFSGADKMIKNTTIAFNTAYGYGGGVWSGGGGKPKFKNTIVANNTSVKPAFNNCNNNSNLGFDSQGNNLEYPGTACGFKAIGDIQAKDPLLAPLAGNGGTTETHALQLASPALGTADDIVSPSTDQRGVQRPQGARSDIGAFELETNDSTPPATTLSATAGGSTYAEGTWTNQDVTTILSAIDEGGSGGAAGVKEITYFTSGGQSIPESTVAESSASVPTINTEGETTISFYATDNVGNQEPLKSFTIRIDKTYPKVIGVHPYSRATRVSRTINVTATFSEPVGNMEANFKLYRKGSNTPVGAVVSPVAGTNNTKWILNPNRRLKADTSYIAKVLTGVEDVAGHNLDQNPTMAEDQPMKWFFETKR